MENEQTTSGPVYEELFTLYAQGRTAHHDHYMQGHQFVATFAKQIFIAMGYPQETFRTDTGTAPWVQLFELSEDHTVKRKTWLELTSWDEEGRLRFAVGVSLSHSLDSYPKECLWMGYIVKPTAQGAQLEELSGLKRRYEVSDAAGMAPAVDAFIAQVREVLSRTPEDSFKARPGIGFV